jgi:uncharacterized protein YegP (UPF0339 family)
MAGKFEVYQDRGGKYRFRLKASNGQVVASGEAYETKAAARKGCESRAERRRRRTRNRDRFLSSEQAGAVRDRQPRPDRGDGLLDLRRSADVRRRRDGDHHPMRRPIRFPGLMLHALVVGVPLALFAVLVFTGRGGGANIGAGLVLLVVLALGFPWSLPVFLDPDAVGELPGVLRYAAYVGPALLWIGVHGLVRWRHVTR